MIREQDTLISSRICRDVREIWLWGGDLEICSGTI